MANEQPSFSADNNEELTEMQDVIAHHQWPSPESPLTTKAVADASPTSGDLHHSGLWFADIGNSGDYHRGSQSIAETGTSGD